MSFKTITPSLIIYICMNAVFCLMAANHFEKLGYLSVDLGLKKEIA